MTKANSSTHIILLTSEFPFGHTAECFLEHEIPILASRFSQITILSEKPAHQKRTLPSNCETVVISLRNLDWRNSLSRLFDFFALLKREYTKARSLRHLIYIIRTLVFHLRKAELFRASISKLLSKSPKNRTCVYSYWLDYRALAAALTKAERPDIAAVSRAHSADLYPNRHPFDYLPIHEYLSEKLDQLFPISDHGRQHLLETTLDTDKVVTSRLGSPRALKKRFPIANPEATRIVSIGSLIPIKQIEILIDALSIFKKEDPVRWIHLGDGPLRESLAKRAQATLSIQYMFLGHQQNEKLRQILQEGQEFDILVNTSKIEGIPVSMMEAMSCSIPCIGPDVGAIKEIISHKQNGVLIAPNPCPSEVHEAIQSIRTLDESQKKAMSRAAFNTWLEFYDSGKNFREFARRLQLLLQKTQEATPRQS